MTGITSGKLGAEIRELGVPGKLGGGQIDPDVDLYVTAGWGHFGVDNAVMSGKGRLVPSMPDSDSMFDIFINESVCWRNVPRDVWELTLGGYPVIKKWLSYREKRVLGRALTMEEMTYITDVIRRLKGLVSLGPELDANYQDCSE